MHFWTATVGSRSICPCMNYAKHQKRKGDTAVDRAPAPIFPICYVVAPCAIAISGQRGWTANSPAALADVPA